MTQTRIITAPAAWASALVNGDQSGLSTAESAALAAWRRQEGAPNVVDVARDPDTGEALEARFTPFYGLYAGPLCPYQGGDVLDYVVLDEAPYSSPDDSELDANTATRYRMDRAAGDRR
jgi:hypothetical protein